MTKNHVLQRLKRKSARNDAVSPQYLQNGVLGVVSLNQLRHGTDGKSCFRNLDSHFLRSYLLRNPISIGHWFTLVRGTSSEIMTSLGHISKKHYMWVQNCLTCL